jgi:WD40-like Beta Propeller Repeat
MRSFTKRTSLAVIVSFALLGAGALAAPPTLAAAGEGCPNEQVRVESNVNPSTSQPYSLGLPECRAYEMVTPLEKQQHDAMPVGGPNTSSVAPDGDAVGWVSQGAYAGAENYQAQTVEPTNPYEGQRTASGWVVRSTYPPPTLIEEPSSYRQGGGFSLLSSDFTREAACGSTTPANDPGPTIRCAFREPDGSWLSTSDYTELGGEAVRTEIVGASATGEDVIFYGEAGRPLLPSDVSSDATSCENNAYCGGIYEVTGLGTDSPTLHLVDVGNEGNMIGPEHETGIGAPHPGINSHAISADGSKIFFTATPSNGVPTIYARLNNTETLNISAPECGGECENEESEAAIYQGASADGSKIFFTSKQQLVPGDKDEAEDLYEYDFANPAAHRLVDISGGGLGDTTPGSGARIQGVIGVSEDGSHVYFAAGGVLTTLPNALGQVARTTQAGEGPNVYAYDTQSSDTRFVATASSTDGGLWGEASVEGSFVRKLRLAQITPDGRYLVFDSFAKPITTGPEADTTGAQQVYRYDYETGGIVRVSVGHDGFASDGNTPGFNAVIAPNPADEAGSPAIGDVNRSISESGETIVFVTAEQLQDTATPATANSCIALGVAGGPGCQVYVWHNGAVNLLSDGQDTAAVDYAGMSATGSDIFFQTRTQLVGQDTDSLGDIYDARVDGGFPAPPAEPKCSSEACQGVATPAPAFRAPGTASSVSDGNLTPWPTSFLAATEPKPKPLTRAQELTETLKRCARDRSRAKRKACEKAAQEKFPPPKRQGAKKH